MSDFAKLKSYVDNDPYSRGLSGMNAAAIAADMAVVRNPGDRVMDTDQIADEIGLDAFDRMMESAYTVTTVKAAGSYWATVQHFLGRLETEGINVNNANWRSMITLFAAPASALPLEPADETLIHALADNQLNDAQRFGLKWQPSEADIQRVKPD